MDKPSRRYTDSQRYRRVQVVVATLLAAVILLAGFYLGQRAAYSGMGLDPARYQAMEGEIPQLRDSIAQLQGQLEVQEARHEMDQQALELVRRELAAQKDQIATLEEGLRFYRSLMAPGEIAQGLSLRQPELVALDQPRHIAFRIVAQQEARKHNVLKGQLTAQVRGLLNGEQVSYPLSTLSEDIESGKITLRFRYFQSIEGQMILPEGFEPASVTLVASATAPRKAEARAEFPWQVQEKFTHVGK